MTTNLRSRNYAVAAGGVLTILASILVSGCGLISSDVTNFDLTLPDKKFTIDASTWQVDNSMAQTVLMTQCQSSQLCNTAAQQACAMNCSGECVMSKCELALQVSLYQPIDLVSEKPELKSINDQPVIKVTIDSVNYEVTSNTLNVATPEMTIYVAPMSVMNPNDPMAVAIGTIDSVPAGMTTASQSIHFTASGMQSLINVMSTFKTPFNVIVGSVIKVKAGDMVPAGKLDAVVHIKAHAGL